MNLRAENSWSRTSRAQISLCLQFECRDASKMNNPGATVTNRDVRSTMRRTLSRELTPSQQSSKATAGQHRKRRHAPRNQNV